MLPPLVNVSPVEVDNKTIGTELQVNPAFKVILPLTLKLLVVCLAKLRIDELAALKSWHKALAAESIVMVSVPELASIITLSVVLGTLVLGEAGLLPELSDQ